MGANIRRNGGEIGEKLGRNWGEMGENTLFGRTRSQAPRNKLTSSQIDNLTNIKIYFGKSGALRISNMIRELAENYQRIIRESSKKHQISKIIKINKIRKNHKIWR